MFVFYFFSYLPLGITPPIFNMGSMLTGSANRPATNLAYHEPPGQFLMGSKLFTLNNWMSNVFKKKKKNSFGLYEILPFPWQPVVQIEFWQYT